MCSHGPRKDFFQGGQWGILPKSFPGGTKSGVICFLPLEIEKTTFFANNFKIEGGKPPPSDAHACSKEILSAASVAVRVHEGFLLNQCFQAMHCGRTLASLDTCGSGDHGNRGHVSVCSRKKWLWEWIHKLAGVQAARPDRWWLWKSSPMRFKTKPQLKRSRQRIFTVCLLFCYAIGWKEHGRVAIKAQGHPWIF